MNADSTSSDAHGLLHQVKTLIVETLMLPNSPADIGDDQPLFGPGGLGLDSVDALQLVVALDKTFGLKIKDAGEAQVILKSAASIAAAVQGHTRSVVAGQPIPPSEGTRDSSP